MQEDAFLKYKNYSNTSCFDDMSSFTLNDQPRADQIPYLVFALD